MTKKEIEVKALEWRETKTDDGRPQWHSDWFETITLMGSQYGKCERYWLFHAREGFATLEAAKAAAQEHHETRIRSCLLDKPEAVEAPGYSLVERLEQRISVYRDMTPEDGETWESWYFAAFDMLSGESSRLRAPADTDAAQSELASLRRELEEARGALRQMRCPRPCNHQPEDLDAGDCIDAGECGCIDSQFRDALIAGALQRADARESLFPEMSSRIKAKREQARRKAFEEAAELIEANIVKDSSAGKFLAPRQEGNRDGLHYAAAIRQRAEEKP